MNGIKLIEKEKEEIVSEEITYFQEKLDLWGKQSK